MLCVHETLFDRFHFQTMLVRFKRLSAWWAVFTIRYLVGSQVPAILGTNGSVGLPKGFTGTNSNTNEHVNMHDCNRNEIPGAYQWQTALQHVVYRMFSCLFFQGLYRDLKKLNRKNLHGQKAKAKHENTINKLNKLKKIPPQNWRNLHKNFLINPAMCFKGSIVSTKKTGVILCGKVPSVERQEPIRRAFFLGD